MAISQSPGANANILIRLAVGGVFLNEGLLKFLDPAANAAGRFAALGLPHPELLGPFVGAVEVLGGALVILGYRSRGAALALFIDISAAIFTTKIPVLLGHAYLGLTLLKLPRYGVLSMVHEARTDLAMWFGLLFLLVAGPGRWALDARSGGKTAAGGT
jgi:putative oxidoreductase